MKKVYLIAITAILLCAPILVQAQACNPNAPAGTTLCNAIPGVSLQGGPGPLFANLFRYLGGIIGLLAIMMLVYSGFRMIIARGEPDALKAAKSGFGWAIGGFVISVMSFVLVLAIQNFIGVDPNSAGTSGILTPLGTSNPRAFAERVLVNTMVLIGILATLMLVYNAFLYVTSGANEELSKKSKTGMLWSVVGFLTTILAYVIITAIITALN